MIHSVVIIILLGISHMFSLMIMTEPKYSPRKTALIYACFCGTFTCLSTLAYVLLESAFLSYAVGFVVTIVMSFFVFIFASADPLCKKVFLFISYSNVFCILGCISIILSNIFLKKYSDSAALYGRNVIRTLLTIPMLAVYSRFLRPYVRSVPGKQRDTWYSISAVSVLFLVFFAMFVVEFYGDTGDADRYILFFVFSILIYASLLWGIFGTIRSMIEKTNMELVKNNVAYLQAQLETARENELNAKTVRHDFHHHNQNIAYMLKNGEVQEALKYLEEYNESLDGANIDEFCPNITVNAILNSFYARAQRCGMSFYAEADVKEDNTTADVDFVAILSNLLENAFDGCLECKSSGDIRVNIRTVEDKTVIVCCNPCREDISIENNMLSCCGVGITSMLSAIRKYGGDIKYSAVNGILTACVILINA